MTSIDNLLYEISSSIPEEDRSEFRDYNDFVRICADNYLDQRLTVGGGGKYMEFVVKPLAVSNGQVELPRYKEIVQVVGSSNKQDVAKSRNLFYMNSRVEGWLGKKDKSMYLIKKVNDGCPSEDCDMEMVMNAERFYDELAVGQDYALISKVYGENHMFKDVEETGFRLMAPSTSNLSSMKKHFIKDCINLGIKTGPKYEFRINYDSRAKKMVLETGFKEGVVILSYYGRVYDEKGIIMLPDNTPMLFEAMKYYIYYKVYEYLTNKFKTPDYQSRERNHFEKWLGFNGEAIKEMNKMSYAEIAPIVAKIQRETNNYRSIDSVMRIDTDDVFQKEIDQLHNY